MDIQTTDFEIRKTARFASYGNQNDPQQVWFVLHGYGQLCNRFIRGFESLDPNTTLIIAPEGLHRYYLKGSAGHVGSSWMTKEARLTDIDDYVNYLNTLCDHILSKTTSNPEKILLGFSQGAATACRWATYGKHAFKSLVLWGSVFPPDLDFELSRGKLKNSNTIMVIGDNDEYYSIDSFEEHCDYLRHHKIEFDTLTYSGTHKIYPKTVLELQGLIN